MNILVINGSPKGEYSVTLQTSLYLQLHVSHVDFHFLHVGQTIAALERDFTPAAEAITDADLIIFSYPVYTFLAPSQLHRFIELLKQQQMDLSKKYATQITTSKHFYDVTAHRYIKDNCQDLGLRYINGLSADMEDLLSEKGRTEAMTFFRFILWNIKHRYYEPVPAPAKTPVHCPVHPVFEDTLESSNNQPEISMLSEKEVVIVTDCETDNLQLKQMIERFQQALPIASHVVNIREYGIRGGCLGCFNCAVSGKCIYTDGFDTFLRTKIQTGAAIVYAFTIKDHSMGSMFKMYDDRQFCNGHRTVTMGMPMGYLISGSYSVETNLQTVIEARCDVGGNFLAGVATDEVNTDASIDRLAQTLTYALIHHYSKPQTFYGVGGMKIFRDLIYLMQGMMKADHKFYKEHGQYDFPQKHMGTVLKMYLVGTLISSPKIKSKIGNKMNEGMLAPYKKILK